MFNRSNQTLFPGQQPEEKILLVFRQHWIVLALKLVIWFFFLLILLASDYTVNNLLAGTISQEYIAIFNTIKAIYLLFLFLGGLMLWMTYYLNVNIITNERIVDIDQPTILTHTISELHLEQVQDVTAEVHGLLENLFDFGDVHIQTAAETKRFLFDKVPNPTKITKLILDLYEQIPDQKKPITGPTQNQIN